MHRFFCFFILTSLQAFFLALQSREVSIDVGERKLLHVYSFLFFHPNSRSFEHNTGDGTGSDEGPAGCAVPRDGLMIMMVLSEARVSF